MTKTQTTIDSVPELPDWLNARTWNAFLLQRKKKATNTDYAKELILRKLDEMRIAGHDPNSVLDESIEGGWAKVYWPKEVTTVRGMQQDPPPRQYMTSVQAPQTAEQRAASVEARERVMQALRPNLRRVR